MWNNGLWPPFDIIPLWTGLCRANNFFYSHSNSRQVADKSDIYNQLNMTGMILFLILGLPWHHLWVRVAFISYNLLFISYLFGGFLKTKFFHSHSNQRQGPDMQDIYNNQWNMTGTISVKSYSVCLLNSYILQVMALIFLECAFFSHPNWRQGPDMQEIYNQWNMTCTISVKSYSGCLLNSYIL